MRYLSTRGQCPEVGFCEAVATGLAPDGGLYLPEELPNLAPHLGDWAKLSYADLCRAFFGVFATDLEPAVLDRVVADAYSRFDHADIAPLVPLDDRTWVLELFHGPTLAFKDFALQLLGNLYAEQIKRTGRPLNVLGATSGDTGAAAIHGLLGKPGVHIFILYPNGRVAPLQERQMTCTGAANVFPLAIEGSFDDAQAALKETFADQEFRTGYGLSAVNSINLARVLAQCVYYFWAWLRLPESARGNVEFVVPTGNFGNVLAGWMAQQMGLPATSFRVATNQNDILYRLFTTGRYEVDQVAPSRAPSMDIQVASNFERYLYYAVGRNQAKVREVMATFKSTGTWVFEGFDRSTFTASRADDDSIRSLIADVYKRTGYVADPHTACGFVEHDPEATSVVLATAHPAKFPDTIAEAIGIEATHPTLEALKSKPIDKHLVNATMADIQTFIRENAVR